MENTKTPPKESLPTCTVKNHLGPEVLLTEDQKQRNGHRIEKILSQQLFCKGCTGKCQQEIQGMVPIVNSFRGYFAVSLTYCPLEEQLREQKKYKKLLKESALPQIFTSKRFADLEQTSENKTAIQAAYEMAKNPNSDHGLYLYGPPGTGKTLLVSLIGKGLCFCGKPVLFISVTDLFHLLRSHIRTDWQDVFQKYAEIPCLILDDLGAERLSDWSMEQLYRLIDTRYKAGLQTLISSNWSLEELASELTENPHEKPVKASRIISRMTAMTDAIPVKGVDHRTQKKNGPSSLFA